MGTTSESQTAADPAASADAAAPARIVGPAIRTWLHHLVPLTLLSAIALSPLVALAARVHAPADAAAARPVIQLGWTLLAVAWLGQLLLVGGAAAMLTEPPSQLRAFTRGFLQLIRSLLPCLVAALAVAIGSLALLLPGLALLVLLSLTAASRERGLPAPLLDSLAAARRQLPAVALAVVALFAIDAAIGLGLPRVPHAAACQAHADPARGHPRLRARHRAGPRRPLAAAGHATRDAPRACHKNA